jgi:hypothetical protein
MNKKFLLKSIQIIYLISFDEKKIVEIINEQKNLKAIYVIFNIYTENIYREYIQRIYTQNVYTEWTLLSMLKLMGCINFYKLERNLMHFYCNNIYRMLNNLKENKFLNILNSQIIS